MRMRWAWGFLLALAIPAPYAAGAKPPSRVVTDEPREEDVRLLEVVLDESLLSEALAAYAGRGGGTLLPLGATTALLGIAIKVDLEAGQASGFVLEERRV